MLVLNKPFGLAVQGGTRNAPSHRRHAGRHGRSLRRPSAPRPSSRPRHHRRAAGRQASCQAAAKLGRTFQTRSAAKTYWALVKGVPKPPQGKIEAALVKASGPDGDRMRKSRPGEQKEAMHATTHYSVIDRAAHKVAWVSLKPVTGRQHQLRAHMELIGNPIVGDNKYDGGTEPAVENIEDEAAPPRAPPDHSPSGGPAHKIDVSAPLPAHMLATWELLGFDPHRFDKRRRMRARVHQARHIRLRRHARRQPARHRRGDGGRLRGRRPGMPAARAHTRCRRPVARHRGGATGAGGQRRRTHRSHGGSLQGRVCHPPAPAGSRRAALRWGARNAEAAGGTRRRAARHRHRQIAPRRRRRARA